MKLLNRLAEPFRDSPNFIRDKANLVSGITVGTAALLLNAAVIMLFSPLVLAPDDRSFLAMTENVGLGQLLALVLLGGATMFATILIPLRLLAVFWGPRIGRYFDQVVLSGISPVRFVIGKATSQNLFLALILFLLLPYFVLSLTLGGVNVGFCLACLFLLWLYCMALAMLTIWLSLYFNELITVILVIVGSAFMIGLGCIPVKNPFFLSPAPALLQPIYQAIPSTKIYSYEQFLPVFIACAGAMSLLIAVAFIGVHLGPLYGIIRENSTFGEVVRKGDSKKKRWLRLRLHIQRPSEIAFLYENRKTSLEKNEGLIRWGLGFALLTIAVSIASYSFPDNIYRNSRNSAYEVIASLLLSHAAALTIAVFLFSHTKNTTLQKIAFWRGKSTTVSKLDWIGFLLFTLVSNCIIVGAAFLFDAIRLQPVGQTILSATPYNRNTPVDLIPLLVLGSIMISVSGLLVYSFHRFICLFTWLKSASIALTALIYIGLFGFGAMMVLMLWSTVEEVRGTPVIGTVMPILSQASPLVSTILLCGEYPQNFTRHHVTQIPFYLVHLSLIAVMTVACFRREKKLAEQYFAEPNSPARPRTVDDNVNRNKTGSPSELTETAS